MSEKKTDVLNLRLDSGLAAEIDRIATWRGKSTSEVARDLLLYGVAVERDLEAEELRRPFSSAPINRNGANTHVQIEAKFRFYTVAEMARFEQQLDEGDVVETSY